MRRMVHAYIGGVGHTAFGQLPGRSSLQLMAQAADRALADAGLEREQVDGLLCGYSTVHPHLMFATLFAEYFDIRPRCALALQNGGATGSSMLMLARDLVRAGRCRDILVVAGENRRSGQSSAQSVATLAQVGDPLTEVSAGATVPAYYALVASRYLHETRLDADDLAFAAVQMRANAARHPDAHMRAPLGARDVTASRPIASPLRLLDCCPLSDGAAAVVVSARDRGGARLAGAAQVSRHQHLSAMHDVMDCGAAQAAHEALAEAGVRRDAIGYLGIYDSYTVTLCMLLEQTGFCAPGTAARLLERGGFAAGSGRALNTHGGLLSFGHPGVAGGLMNVVEAALQLSGRAADRQAGRPAHAFVHGEGGVLSSHVSLVLSAA